MESRRVSWPELCASDDFRGLWVALDNCQFDEQTRRPIAGELVDMDEELSELCVRMRRHGRCSCAILRCQ